MSAVKRVFTHSAIRSAIRKPFIANDDGYREYLKRSVFELNGTQWGELSESVVLDGDFEIEFVVCPGVGNLQTLLGKTPSTAHFIRITNITTAPTVSVRLGIGETQIQCPDIVPNLVQKLAVIKTGTVVDVYLSGVLQDSVDNPLWTDSFKFDLIGSIGSLTQTLTGILLSTRCWTNGDRNTGDLILNVPFDESGSDYQRNRAVVGSFVDANRNWYYQGDLIGDSDLIEIDFPSGDSGPAATASGAVFNPEKSYVVVYEVLSLSVGGSVRLNHGSNGVQDEPYDDTTGIKTAYVIANGSGNGTMQFYALAGTQAQIRIVSIREWSGVILQNALPEHWMQIERKRWWNYWLGKPLTTLSNSGDLDITKNVLKSGDTYTRNSSDQSCYVGKTLVGDGEKRLISLQVRMSNLSNSALYIPIRLQNQYPARMDVIFTREGGIHIPASYSSSTDIELHELSAEVESDDLVINILVETSQRLSFYISPRNEATGDLDNADPDTTVSFDFGYVSATIRRKLEIAQ